MARQTAVGFEELIFRKMATFRRWKKTKLYKRQSKWGFEFTVMTYNILSQTAVENHRYLYRHCNPAFLMEEYRISKIIPEILKSKSDIICLQEVEEHVFANRMKQVFDSNGFSSIFKRRTGFKTDGCAILWRKRKFELVQHRDVEYRSIGSELLDRDNIGLIATLKPIHPCSQNTLLHIATTHLLFNPKRGDIKLCQLRWLLAELERMSLKEVKNETRYYHPVVLCGDFNIEPHSPLYQFIETGCIDVENILSGDMSGQADGKYRGKRVNAADLLLHELGINGAGRFMEMSRQIEPSKAGSSKMTVNIQSHPNSTSSDESVNRSLVAAMGSSTDPRWIQTWLALGNKQLAENIAARVLAKEDTPNNKYNSNMDRTSTYGSGENDSSSFYHDFNFVPAYKFHQLSQKDIPVTSMTGRDFNTVDHIFYNVKNKRELTSYSEGKLKLLSVYSLMSSEQIEELSGLPNAAMGSDHVCLMAKFAICFRR